MRVLFDFGYLRARLGKRDVQTLERGRPLTTRLTFGPLSDHVFELTLERTRAEAPSWIIGPGLLHIELPAAWLAGWSEDAREGFSLTIPVEGFRDIQAEIQKDYACTTPDAGCSADGADPQRFPRPEPSE